MTDKRHPRTRENAHSDTPRATRIIDTPRSMLPAGIAVYNIRTDAIRDRRGAEHTSPPESIAALADSIHKYGIIHPLSVKSAGDGCYTLVSGSRRLKAARLLGLLYIPCLVITEDEAKCSSISLCENFHSHEMHYIEVAEGIGELCKKYGYSETEAAARLCISLAYTKSMLALLSYSEQERAALKRSRVAEATAVLLLKIDDARIRSYILSELVSEKITHTGVEHAVRMYHKKHRTDIVERSCTYLIRDVRIFYNSVDRAIEVMRRAGHNITAEKKDMGEYTLLTVKIPK